VGGNIAPFTVSIAADGALPDVAGEFVTVRTGPIQKTVTVRGHCRPGFEKLYTALSRAAGVR